ncbi:peptidase M19 renal dipeptidase [Desulfovibrio sp. X2]|uniref:dipeptidase n=1 Tax=Desulfovibrio sp. X2 TaxID=941449 RepID=UPI000358D602|nr:membrane dipeptidase [Desulfovibrio sp. X2]EPR41629.1 peptidase M19 renal dipeptidase [Desulfovibrio sp. X2]
MTPETPADTSPPVFDAHVDLGCFLREQHPGLPFHRLESGPVTLDGLRAGNVRVLVNALYTPDAKNGPASAALHLQRLLDHARTHLTGLSPVMGSWGLRAAFAEGAGGDAPHAAEPLPTARLLMVENADPLLEYPLDALALMGVRVVGLTHIGTNRVADGNGVAAPAGFSREGKKLVRGLAEAGLAVDVAHLSRPALAELPELFPGPLCATHTGFTSFLDIPRNLTEETIRLIVERGGVVGLTLAPEMLAADRRADLELVYAHVDWFVERFGVAGLGIGSDFCGFAGEVAGLESAARLPALAARLHTAGYAEEDVAAIFGRNWLGFYSRLYESGDADGNAA